MTWPKQSVESGFTIVELMISLALSALLLITVVSLFMATQRNETAQEHLNRISDDARFFSDFIAHDLRMAGFSSDQCTLGQPGLEWDQGSEELTIRYCEAESVKTIRYQFSDDGDVMYSDKSTGNLQPLAVGLELLQIRFAQKTSSGVAYVANNLTDFENTLAVSLRLQLRGELKPNQVTSETLSPTLQIESAVRNHL